MSVTNSISRSGPYAGANQTGPFSITFRFLDNSHVQLVQTSAGVETTLTYAVDYTLAGAGSDSGGAAALIVALPVGQTLTIIRNVPITQETDYTQSDPFPAESHEDALDKLTMIAQQLQDGVNRSLRVPEAASTLPEFPPAAARANTVPAFDASGNPTVMVPASGSAADVLLQLAASGGSGQVGSIYPGANSASVTVAARLGETVSARFYGDKANGTISEYTAQVQAAANYAITQGGALYFNQGVHEINDIATTGTLRLRGDGAGVTVIRLRGTKHRWTATLSAAEDILIAEGVTFETDSAPEGSFNTSDPNTALHVKYTMTGFDNRDGRRVFTDDVEFRGQDLTTDGWAVALWMENINGSVHINPWFRGIALNGTDDGAEASNTISQLGVQIDGAEYPTDHRFITPTFYSFELCINGAGKIEGLTIDGAVAVNVGMMLIWTPAIGFGGRPGMKYLNGHCNSYKGVLQLNGIQQAQLEGGELYHNPGSASDWIGYELNSVIDANVSSNGYYRYLDNADAHTSTAIYAHEFQSNNIVVDDEIFGGNYTRLDVGVKIAADLSATALTVGPGCRWNGNYRVADVQNLGVNAQVLGARALLARRTAAQATTTAVVAVVDWDTLVEDTSTIWPDVAGVFTIPTGRGIERVRVTVTVMWDANATGIRQARILKGASVFAQTNLNAASAGVTATTIVAVFMVAGGDTVSVDALQTSGGALNVTGAFTNCSIEVLT